MLKNNKVTFAGAGIALGLTMLMSPTPSAQAVTFSGTTVGAPTWNRPVANDPNPPTVLSGTTVSYSKYDFTVDTSGSYDFGSVGINPFLWDNYTFLYKNSFNAANPLANTIIGNDNLFGITGLSGFTGVALTTGTNYFFVTTGKSSTDTGSFLNSITGPGSVSQGSIAAVPEPATILGSLMAFGYGAYSRRRIKITQSIEKKTV